METRFAARQTVKDLEGFLADVVKTREDRDPMVMNKRKEIQQVKVNGDVTCVDNPIGGNYNHVDWNEQKHQFQYLKDLCFEPSAEPLRGEMFPVLLGNDFTNLTKLDEEWITQKKELSLLLQSII